MRLAGAGTQPTLGRRSPEKRSPSHYAASSLHSREPSELAVHSREIALREGPGANQGLVLCTLHGKWRHQDRMARKGTGEWVCTGEDKCKVGDGRGQGVAPPCETRTPVSAPTSGSLVAPAARTRSPPRRRRCMEHAPRSASPGASQGSSQSRASSQGSGLSAFAAKGNRRSGRRVRTKLRRSKAGAGAGPPFVDDRGMPLPLGMRLCEVHRRARFQERLVERRPGYWVCKHEDRCKNMDEVRCVLHDRWRTPQNMEWSREHNDWVCKSDCQCR